MDSEYSLIKPVIQPDVCPETELPRLPNSFWLPNFDTKGTKGFVSRKKPQSDPFSGQSAGEAILTKYFTGCLAMILAFASCETTSFSPSVDDRFVVQAYLYAGEPVTDIRITSTLPLGSEDSTVPPINDAEVVLIKDGERYGLVPSPGDSGYYHYPGDDLVIETGDLFDFEATAAGVTATARTTVPPPPDDVSLSSTEVPVASFWPAEPIVVQWPNPQGHWYFITHMNIEPQPKQIFDGIAFIRPSLLVSEPTNEDFIEIPTFRMRYFGRYEVKVHRVNQEYVDLYLSREQDTRDLNEPETNINNGIGIFTAFSSRPAYFEVVP